MRSRAACGSSCPADHPRADLIRHPGPRRPRPRRPGSSAGLQGLSPLDLTAAPMMPASTTAPVFWMSSLNDGQHPLVAGQVAGAALTC